MFRSIEYENIRQYLSGFYIDNLIEDDKWRLNNNFFGFQEKLVGNLDTVLFLGARSGLEILFLLLYSSNKNILVVEPNKALWSEISESLSKQKSLNFKDRVKYYSQLEEVIELTCKRNIDHVRVDSAEFRWTEIEKLVSISSIGHICGEFNPIDVDPLLLFRTCRKNVRSFFWRVVGFSMPVSEFSDKRYKYEVSVVVPAYKVRPWMDRCLDSLSKQTIENIEIIIVDDGSPDETGSRADEWVKMFPNKIKVIHKKNGGCASARNAGLLAAEGEYVGFVDADDWVDNDMFEELFRSAILNATDVSQCGYVEFFEDSGKQIKYSTAWGGDGPFGLSGTIHDPKQLLVVKPTIWRRIYKKEFLIGNGILFPEKIRRFDDLPFQFEVLSRVPKISLLPNCYYFYRQEREGQDIAIQDERLFVHFPIFEWLHHRVGIWAKADIEKYLLQCEINTHLWAISRLEKKYSKTYLRMAAHQLFKFRYNVSFLSMLYYSSRLGRKAIWFILVCRILSKFKHPPINLNN